MVLSHSNVRKGSRTLIVFIMLALLLLGIAPPARPAGLARGGPQALPAPCEQVSAALASECAALVDLYNTAGGAGWVNSTGWLTILSPDSPCDWYGVACADGHVVELSLSANRLTGTLPNALGNLPYLQRLFLAANQLQGAVPPTICALVDTVTAADVSYNALFTRHANTRLCLERLDSGWTATQTIAPRDLRPAAIETGAVQLAWAPIAYTADGGFYEVSYATTVDGPYTVHGRTADKSASSYRLDGLTPGSSYFVRVQTVTPPHANHADEVHSDYTLMPFVSLTAETFLLLVYFPADNDLAPYVRLVRERLRLGSQFNPNVRVVMLSDSAGAGDTELVTIAGGSVQTTDAVFAQWGTRELNTADPQVLAWFLRYGRGLYPSNREMVSIMGHGIALAPEVTWPTTAAAVEVAAAPNGPIPALPKGIDATPGDVTDRGYMSTVGIGQALATATDNGATPFDVVFFDQCFQGNLDTLYEVRGAADVFIASPNYAWLVAPYSQYIALLAPAATTEQIAEGIITRYERNLDETHPNVIFSIRRADIEAIAVAVSALGEALQRAVRAGEISPIARAVYSSRYVDTTQCGRQNLTLGPPDELIGAGTFALNLKREFAAAEPYGVQAAADQVVTSIANIRKLVRVGIPYIAPDEFWDYDNTVTILAPLPPNSPSRIVWRSSIYTETMPLQAIWTPAPTMTVTVSASFAYVRDGSWDEFLAEWYAAPLTPTVGEWCNYIPPVVIADSSAEDLTLTTAIVDVPTIRLAWSPTAHEDVAGYWLYTRSAYDIGWVAYAFLPANQTAIELDNLLPGVAYSFQIVAQDAAGVALAQSNEGALTVPTGRVYLPIVHR